MPPIPLLDQIKMLPAKPGVYTFRDAEGAILYIGKAKNLKNRVSSYFRFPNESPAGQQIIQSSPDLEPAKQLMISRAASLETILVSSETEALILEAELIKRHRPPFNVIFVDDKSFVYIKFDFDGVWPDVYPVRRPVRSRRSRSLLFGPYPSARAAYTVLRLGKRLFPYCMKLPRHALPRHPRGCLNWHIGRCPGPCMGKVAPREYEANLRQMIPLFRGLYGSLKRDLVKQMRTASARRDFETAARLRDQAAALDTIADKQNIISPTRESYDVISLARSGDDVAANLFRIREGALIDRVIFPLKQTEQKSDEELIQSFTEIHYATTSDIPPLALVPVRIPSPFPSLRIEVPLRGKKRQLMLMGRDNAEEELRRLVTHHQLKASKTKEALVLLKEALELETLPKRIEAYDISNIQGSNAVGAMTVMVDGELKPREYRSFIIRHVQGSNDVAMLAEVLVRRFARSVRHGGMKARRHEVNDLTITKKPNNLVPQKLTRSVILSKVEGSRTQKMRNSSTEDWPLPDLVVIDGGKPQLSAAQMVLAEYGLNIPLLGIAKGRGLETQRRYERGEEIWYVAPATRTSAGSSAPTLINLSKNSPALMLLDRLRDEAHRRGITHYRKRHEKSVYT